MTVKFVEREAEAFEALQKLEAAAMAEGGLLSLYEVQRRVREDVLEELDAQPRDIGEEDSRRAMAEAMLDVVLPKYSKVLQVLGK